MHLTSGDYTLTQIIKILYLPGAEKKNNIHFIKSVIYLFCIIHYFNIIE